MRGGVVSRTGDRVGDALEMRTRRVGVEGFVVASLRTGERSVVASLRTGERSILLSFLGAGCPLPRFFLPRAALWALFFWAAEALSVVVDGALLCVHDVALPTVFNWARLPIRVWAGTRTLRAELIERKA